jgi:hypothetical protein
MSVVDLVIFDCQTILGTLGRRTKRIGLVLKILAGIFLPLPLLLLPVLSILGSLLVGVGYGVFAPLMATFEAVGEGVADKLSHCFLVRSTY